MEQYENRIAKSKGARLDWFQEAKFGMFIHWGLYSHLAGFWQGKEVPNLGEQIMRYGAIPRKEYREIAKEFNPIDFNAEDIVLLAKKAGMKYIVITAKHHDGFAMYHSEVSSYNIVESTPYSKDPMEELMHACKKHGMILGFYYSHRQDWDHPHGFVACPPKLENPLWDPEFLQDNQQRFEQYMNEKAIPQVVELLTKYEDVGIIWYDTPGTLSDYNSKRFEDIVHAIQPDCIVSPRVSANPQIGDYLGFEDNQVPYVRQNAPWEVCATMNDTWGYKERDYNWKSAKELLELLISIVGQGGNYLLNIGPTGTGEIPKETEERLLEISGWMENHSESIHDAEGGIMLQQPIWGAVTGRDNKLYFHFVEYQEEIIFTGLQNKVKEITLLSTNEKLPFVQSREESISLDTLIFHIPEIIFEDTLIPVVKVVFEKELQLQELSNDMGNNVLLEGHSGIIQSESQHPLLKMDQSGVIVDWSQKEDSILWHFGISKPGKFKVLLHTLSKRYPKTNIPNWEGGHELEIITGENTLVFTVSEEERKYPRNNKHWDNIITKAGDIEFFTAGRYELELKANYISFEKGIGIRIKEVELIPYE